MTNDFIPITYPNLNGNEKKYLIDAFDSSWISSKGYYIDQFEEKFANYCDCKYGVAVSNGTVALHLALVALGINENHEVIVPDLTFAATINAVLYCKATPVIVDIEKKSWCIDPVEIRKHITKRTRAIIPVHLYGQPANMEEILKIAHEFNLFVIEDCAEAHGAEFKNKKIGSFGHINCFSFYGNKVLTTGEGGMCVTNSYDFYEKMKIFRDHGMSKVRKYWHEMIGYNYRMTNMQAAIGLAQLERAHDLIQSRIEVENNYKEIFKNSQHIEFQPDQIPDRKKITWLVSVLVNNNKREQIIELFNDNKLDIRKFFYTLSGMKIYQQYATKNVISKEISERGLNLPTIINIFANKEFKKRITKISEVLND